VSKRRRSPSSLQLIRQRLEFANEAREPEYWKRVLFPDETVLLLEPNPQYRYIEVGEEQPVREKSKYSPRIMV
jgi:hypothetical protein